MTRHSKPLIAVLTRLLPMLLMSLLEPLAGCGGSTDTGNPTLVAEGKIHIVTSDGGVRVSAEPGAVEGGARVEVTNLATGASESTTAGEDGSFEVSIEGSTSDDYRIDVSIDGRSATVTIGPNSGGGSLNESLLDREFLLDSADGYTPRPGVDVSVSFSADGFGFSAGCNRHFGDYTLCGDKLCISGFGSTLIGCSEEAGTQDEWFADFFTGEPGVALSGDQLTFTGVAATLVFLDREVANPDRPLTGRTWTVDTMISGGAATNLPIETPPTLEFGQDGTLNAFSGCNDLIYEYAVDGQEIALTFVSSTRNACMGAAGQLSSHMSQVFDGTVTYEIDAQRLTLMNGELGLGATTD